MLRQVDVAVPIQSSPDRNALENLGCRVCTALSGTLAACPTLPLQVQIPHHLHALHTYNDLHQIYFEKRVNETLRRSESLPDHRIAEVPTYYG